MVEVDTFNDQRYVQVESSYYCGNCMAEMMAILPGEFRCPKCGQRYVEKKLPNKI
ncbi:MAG TPA: hypothetical protein VJC16_07730 [Candidatus Nanoarchaeia archaeon]|nr:hypothetical protein [Candidatus Nanoarchaeia archaeon]